MNYLRATAYALALMIFSQIHGLTLGIECTNFAPLERYKKGRIGLVANQTSIDQRGNRGVDILRRRGFNIVELLAPEHGFTGTIPAGQQITDSRDALSRLPIVSLYISEEGSKNVRATLAPHIDTFFVDLQDCGMRHYTYISTLLRILEYASAYHKNVVVFDRPNPLGIIMEGPLVEPAYISFVSIAPIPLRHALTIGELARYFNTHIIKHPANLLVVPLKEYRRTDGLKKLRSPLSPNIPNIDACRGYSLLGLLGEVKPFFIGIPSGAPFQVIMLPGSIKTGTKFWDTIAQTLKTHGIQSKRTTLYANNESYIGLRLRINDPNHIHAFQALLDILKTANANNIALDFKAIFDKAMGTNKVRRLISGSLDKTQFTREINKNLDQFWRQARSCFLYEPAPIISYLPVPQRVFASRRPDGTNVPTRQQTRTLNNRAQQAHR